MRIRISNVFLSIYMFHSHHRQIRLLSINTYFLSSYFSGGFWFSSPCGFKETLGRFEIYYHKLIVLVSIPSKEYRVCFLQTSATSIYIYKCNFFFLGNTHTRERERNSNIKAHLNYIIIILVCINGEDVIKNTFLKKYTIIG